MSLRMGISFSPCAANSSREDGVAPTLSPPGNLYSLDEPRDGRPRRTGLDEVLDGLSAVS